MANARERRFGPDEDLLPIAGLPRRSAWSKGLVIATAFVLTVAATAFVIDALDGSSGLSLNPGEWPSSQVPLLDLSVATPPGWRFRRFDEQVGTVGFSGALVSNEPMTVVHPEQSANAVTTAWDTSRLPSDGVLVSIERVIGGPPTPDPHRLGWMDTPLPLRLGDAKTLGKTGDTRLLAFTLGGQHLSVRVWFGPDASASDRSIPAGITASITPLDGTVIRDIPTEPNFFGVAASGGTAWTSYGRFLRIPTGAQESEINLEQPPFVLAAAPDAGVWAAGYDPSRGDYIAHFGPEADTPDIRLLPPGRINTSLLATSPEGNVLALEHTINGGGPGSLWDIDGATGTVRGRISLADLQNFPHGSFLAYALARTGDTAYLLGGAFDPQKEEVSNIGLSVIDLTTARLIATYDAPSSTSLVVADDVAWLSGRGGIVRLDPASGATTDVPLPVRFAVPFASAGSSIWVLDSPGGQNHLLRYDASSGKVTLEVQVPRSPSWGYVQAAYDGQGHVWLAHEGGPIQEVFVGTGG